MKGVSYLYDVFRSSPLISSFPQLCNIMHANRLVALTSMTLLESHWAHGAFAHGGAFVVQRRSVRLPSRHQLSATDGSISGNSVTGPIYEMPAFPSVKLFTKEGCTLCDKVKDVRI
jgi:hypothetical protein